MGNSLCCSAGNQELMGGMAPPVSAQDAMMHRRIAGGDRGFTINDKHGDANSAEAEWNVGNGDRDGSPSKQRYLSRQAQHQRFLLQLSQAPMSNYAGSVGLGGAYADGRSSTSTTRMSAMGAGMGTQASTTSFLLGCGCTQSQRDTQSTLDPPLPKAAR